MSAMQTGKKQCVTCNKSGGIMTCDGCQQSFCGKHSVEHRHELANQLDGIMQEHDLFQQELQQSSTDNSLLEQIDQWEKESITKIQVVAEAARADLQQLHDRLKQQLSKSCYDIAVNLRSAHEADDFSEHDLNRWMEQLKEFKLELTSAPIIQFVSNEYSRIPLVTIEKSIFSPEILIKDEQPSTFMNSTVDVGQERFAQVFGPGKFEEDGFVIRHVGNNRDYVYILGEQFYSHGRHTVRFRIEEKVPLYKIFFGCISSQALINEINYNSSASVGWFGRNETYQHGKRNGRGYDSSEFRTNDVLTLTFDCEKEQIELHHERKNKTSKLQVDIDKTSFPWRLLVGLYYVNNSVRILPNI